MLENREFDALLSAPNDISKNKNFKYSRISTFMINKANPEKHGASTDVLIGTSYYLLC